MSVMLRLGDWADLHGLSRATVYRAFREGRLEERYGIKARRVGGLIVLDRCYADALVEQMRQAGYMVLAKDQFARAVQAEVCNAMSRLGMIQGVCQEGDTG